jgi:hypothetical protein
LQADENAELISIKSTLAQDNDLLRQQLDEVSVVPGFAPYFVVMLQR